MLAGCLVVCACASPASLRSGKPALDQTSGKAPERMAGCISDKFENVGFAATRIQFSTRPTSNGYSISASQTSYTLLGGSDTILLVDISNSSGGSRVQMYTNFIIGGESWVALARSCL